MRDYVKPARSAFAQRARRAYILLACHMVREQDVSPLA